jgi:hypothetical protein
MHCCCYGPKNRTSTHEKGVCGHVSGVARTISCIRRVSRAFGSLLPAQHSATDDKEEGRVDPIQTQAPNGCLML